PCMFLIDGSCQHDDLARAVRRQHKTSLRRVHVGQRPKYHAKPRHFDSQPYTMRFIGEFQTECTRDEPVPRHVSRPRLSQRAYECEQHRTLCERDKLAFLTHDMTAGVYDECL